MAPIHNAIKGNNQNGEMRLFLRNNASTLLYCSSIDLDSGLLFSVINFPN